MKLSCLNCFNSDSGTADRTRQEEQNPENFRVFSHNELRSATNGFHSSAKIGEGGFGSVYKGRLRDGSLVAVKVLSVEVESMRGEREFMAEITALSDIRHENLVTLRGCCVDGAGRYLVYEYMENNSLAHSLLGKQQNRLRFSWETRRNISLGVARALAYLHEEVQPHIVHRDIKASNILLDRDFTPKVSDFGLSKLFTDNMSHVSTRVAGTLGYLAPEYAISGHLTRKSDIYGFGVLLLEIVSGRAVMDFDREYREHYLVQKVTELRMVSFFSFRLPYGLIEIFFFFICDLQAWDAYNANELVQLVDSALENNFPEEEAVRFLTVGLLCVQETAKVRPRMSEAYRMLTNETNVNDFEILQPGLVSDFMNIRTGQKQTTEGSSSSYAVSMFSTANLGR
ncbi:hypothetical protein SO802_030452 [Lithocarpus litseifolius]|uniref:Protein kinase domain-containing protein n=1 Tax=Lithocarpus litseifolius TaxID=425828 RepID=A0AAW2BHH7_9ROSI